MANPMRDLGIINKTTVSVVVNQFPGLNITPSDLGKAGVSLSFSGQVTDQVEQMTGVVTVPNTYVVAEVQLNLVRTQPCVTAYQSQIVDSSYIGNIDVYPDTTALTKYSLRNCSIISQGEMGFAGGEAPYQVTIRGVYDINNSLWQ